MGRRTLIFQHTNLLVVYSAAAAKAVITVVQAFSSHGLPFTSGSY